MTSLDIKKIYIDTRFRTSDSKSDSDFNIELPREVTIPDNVIAYIDDIVIPVSWSVVDDRNNTLYFKVFYNGVTYYRSLTLPSENYTGASFASELETALNTAVAGLEVTFSTSYNFANNWIQLSISDIRVTQPDTMTVTLISDEGLKNGEFAFTESNPKTLNSVLRLTKSYDIVQGQPYYSYVDLHTTRNLYLTSSALASYDIVSNFGNDTIIKKIPVKANYNEMLFDNVGSGFDYLNVSKRSLRYIDFKLVDSYFNTVDMRGNHFSFSIIFQTRN